MDKFEVGLMEIRTTPINGMAPVARVFGRLVRTLVPSANLGRIPEDDFRRARAELQRLEKSRENAFNKRAATRDFNLDVGEEVRVRDAATGKWTRRGKILRLLPHRQVEVEFEDGLVAIRNRSHVRGAAARCFAREPDNTAEPSRRRGTRQRRAPDRLVL